MICPKCGKDAGEAAVCPECGEELVLAAENVEPESPAQEESSPNSADTKKPANKIVPVLVAAIGLIAIIAIFLTFALNR